jgi:hypothetical protein
MNPNINDIQMTTMKNHECPDSIECAPDPDDFDALVGGEFDFYGVDGNCFKIDDKIYEAVEDEGDGWRSMLGCIEAREAQGKIFFTMPVARVVIENDNDEDFEGYKLTDLHDGHEWLRFGTNNYGDYYPYFVFDYTPESAA